MSASRRKFLQNATQLAAGVGLATVLPEPLMAAKARVSANDTLTVGLIGCNSMGWADLSSLLKLSDVRCAALCDVDENVLNRRAGELEKKNGSDGKKAVLYKDYRRMLDNKDIDAVIIGTPDHWHCLQMVDACQAGKDVYVEKPIANSIEECNLMVAAAQRYNRVVQVGQWQRSCPHWQSAVDYVRSGKLGTIRLVKAWAYMPYGKKFPVLPDEPVPAGVDYDTWLGPAPKRPFNRNRFHGSFRYFWDYAGGLMTDWGAHMLDFALYGMNVREPRAVSAMGGKFGFPDHANETPDTMQAIFEFDQHTMLWEQAIGIARGPYDREHGVAFIGNNGTLVVDRSKWELYPQVEDGKYLVEAVPPRNNDYKDLDYHTANFLACVKSRQKTNADIQAGRDAALNAHLGNIAYRTGRRLVWDAPKNLFVNDTKANELVKTTYRAPWKLPKV